MQRASEGAPHQKHGLQTRVAITAIESACASSKRAASKPTFTRSIAFPSTVIPCRRGEATGREGLYRGLALQPQDAVGKEAAVRR
eukprot:5239120-Amphidinium_carterae.1